MGDSIKPGDLTILGDSTKSGDLTIVGDMERNLNFICFIQIPKPYETPQLNYPIEFFHWLQKPIDIQSPPFVLIDKVSWILEFP